MKLLSIDIQHWPVNYNPVQFFWFWISMLLWAVGNILWIAWQQWRACLRPVSWLSSLAGPCTGWCSHPVWGCPWALLPAWSLPRQRTRGQFPWVRTWSTRGLHLVLAYLSCRSSHCSLTDRRRTSSTMESFWIHWYGRHTVSLSLQPCQSC